jgi:hypothetical protein
MIEEEPAFEEAPKPCDKSQRLLQKREKELLSQTNNEEEAEEIKKQLNAPIYERLINKGNEYKSKVD